MNKPILSLTSGLLLLVNFLFAQTQQKLSGTPPAPQQWDNWFNAEVEKFKELKDANKTNFAGYTIPVIFHVLHSGQAVGTAPNIAANRISDQVNELNKVYNGVGANPNAIVHYSQYIANPNISFCLALNDPTNLPIGEPGINRVDMVALFGVNTNTINNDLQLKAFIDFTVKPSIIWDPTKYLNVFVSPKGPNSGMLGFATYPAGTNLQGLGAVGTGTNDGVWVVTDVVGGGTNAGTLAGYSKGKTLCREIGHWLGLKTLWGDATCGTDYCEDTPPSTGPNFSCPSFPFKINSCGNGLSPGGEMAMNIMDYTEDDCRFMFTPDQVIRMQTAMSQSQFRYELGSHALCTSSLTGVPTGPIASFSIAAPNPCFGRAFTPVNTTQGFPAPTFTWVLIPNTATVIPGYNVAMPSINLSNQGTYTLQLIASNSVATTSFSYTFSTFPCPKGPVCMDTLRKIKNTDTLTVYSVNSSTSVIGCNVVNPGFLTGTNCYKDKEYAQYFTYNSYSNTPVPQLSGAFVLFRKSGTKSNSGGPVINCRALGGNLVTGPATPIGQSGVSLSAISTSAAPTFSSLGSPTNNVTWCATPTVTFSSNEIIPYKFSFNPPILLPTSNGFFMSVEMPWVSAQDSAQIFSNTLFNAPISDTSAYVLTATNTWFKLFKARGKNVQLAILPQITCKAKVGLEEYTNELDANIMLMPNPNQGQFSIMTSLSIEQNLNFRIMNYMGTLIGENNEANVKNRLFEIDMSGYSNGVYFVEISNGSQKTVKKMIISK
jgi:hypothetical protein